MARINPFLWFDKEAADAARFYTSVFPNSQITFSDQIPDTPSADVQTVNFRVMDLNFTAINGGPAFIPNPSISMIINFDPSYDKDALRRIDEVWEKLTVGGKILMPLDRYPFSERYGWVQDRYGFSWQLIYTQPEGEERPLVIPSFLFVKDVCGKAEEASDFYLSVFAKGGAETKRGAIMRYPAGAEPDKEGTVMFTDFKLAGQWLAAMDSADKHDFNFNEAVSMVISCKNQTEIDHYWQNLSSVPEAEQSGWLKDKYGVSWQVIPENIDELMVKNPPTVTPALLRMKKIIIADLEKAGQG